MAMDEWSFDPGSYDSGGYIDTSYGSPDPSAYSGYTPDAGTGVSGVQADAPYNPAGAMAGTPSGQPQQQGGGFLNSLFGGGSAGLVPGGPGGLGGSGLGQLGGLQGLLGLGGGLAGLIGAISGGGVTGTAMPKMGTAQTAQINQANQAIQPAAMGQLPLQQQQASMLQALAQGQIPPGFAQLVANAYDPAYQQAATRATEGARQAGFYDNPLSSPVGGAIMGPAAAQLQGQQANSLLGLLQSLPQLFNAPIGNQIGAAQSQSGNLLNAAQLGTGKQTSQPLGAQIGTAIGGGLQGMSQSIGQQNQQQMLGQLLQNQFKGQSPVNTGTMYPGS